MRRFFSFRLLKIVIRIAERPGMCEKGFSSSIESLLFTASSELCYSNSNTLRFSLLYRLLYSFMIELIYHWFDLLLSLWLNSGPRGFKTGYLSVIWLSVSFSLELDAGLLTSIVFEWVLGEGRSVMTESLYPVNLLCLMTGDTRL